VAYWSKGLRASGGSVESLQAVIEKSVVLGLATNTAAASSSLADTVTTYAGTLATQVGAQQLAAHANSFGGICELQRVEGWLCNSDACGADAPELSVDCSFDRACLGLQRLCDVNGPMRRPKREQATWGSA
jgi:hypothetical protein